MRTDEKYSKRQISNKLGIRGLTMPKKLPMSSAFLPNLSIRIIAKTEPGKFKARRPKPCQYPISVLRDE